MHKKIGKIISDLIDIREEYDSIIKDKDAVLSVANANCDTRSNTIKALKRDITILKSRLTKAENSADLTLFYLIISVVITFVSVGYVVYTA